MPDELSFVDAVRSVSPPNEESKVQITFATRAAYYWVASENQSIIDTLTRALAEHREVEVTWDPVSMKIVAAINGGKENVA